MVVGASINGRTAWKLADGTTFGVQNWIRTVETVSSCKLTL